MILRQITDPVLAQNTYLIGCQRTGEGIVVDPKRDVDRYFDEARKADLRLVAVAETHIHADYLSGARELVEVHGAKAYLSGEGGRDWQYEWAKENPNASLLQHRDGFLIGSIKFEAISTPGHTPEHLCYLVTDADGGADEPILLLSGDFLFVGDVGRPDLLESAAGQKGAMEAGAHDLFASLRSIAGLPTHLQVLPAHGAGSACGKALGAIPTSVLGYEKKFNRAFREALSGNEDEFVRNILSGQPEPPLYFARMKTENRMGPPLLRGGNLPSPRRIEVSALSDWVDVEETTLFDLRQDRVAFAERHVKGSLHSPFVLGKLPVVAGSYVEATDRILLLVEDKSQIEEAVRQLIRIGIDRVDAWIAGDEALAVPELTEHYRRIKPSSLPPDALVLDVRGAEEFAEGHVPGATNIAHTRLAARVEEVPVGGPLHIHCAGGLRAAMAASFLARIGREVVHLDGPFADIPTTLKT